MRPVEWRWYISSRKLGVSVSLMNTNWRFCYQSFHVEVPHLEISHNTVDYLEMESECIKQELWRKYHQDWKNKNELNTEADNDKKLLHSDDGVNLTLEQWVDIPLNSCQASLPVQASLASFLSGNYLPCLPLTRKCSIVCVKTGYKFAIKAQTRSKECLCLQCLQIIWTTTEFQGAKWGDLAARLVHHIISKSRIVEICWLYLSGDQVLLVVLEPPCGLLHSSSASCTWAIFFNSAKCSYIRLTFHFWTPMQQCFHSGQESIE